ncbi:hypothetical protein LINGRAHAP2_LOCUS22618 [Linum grandiflorum]
MSSTGGRGRSSRRRRRRPPPRPRSENSVIEAEGGGGRTQVVDDEACSSHPQQSTVAPVTRKKNEFSAFPLVDSEIELVCFATVCVHTFISSDWFAIVFYIRIPSHILESRFCK